MAFLPIYISGIFAVWAGVILLKIIRRIAVIRQQLLFPLKKKMELLL